ncbi:hypothetical protein LEN26_007531 [Aphanomyces euteiches]|nr:hypothetical protein AeMF1_010419 [Aphanomyces euteiches]KAH9132011.1 hypothetical protein LEN26_007531 [Aphanomyces euteiches]KAH9193547.1 hypothetical protein AeNC1_004470 [Aphanomyces euteiches]
MSEPSSSQVHEAPPQAPAHEGSLPRQPLEFRDSEDSLDIDSERSFDVDGEGYASACEELEGECADVAASPVTSPRGIPTALPPLSNVHISSSDTVPPARPMFRDVDNRVSTVTTNVPRQASCSTFFLGEESQTWIEVNWMGEPLGLELQRFKARDASTVDIVWREGSVGLTFGIEQATRQVVVKRSSRNERDVSPGYILFAANGQPVMESNFDATMQVLKAGHDAGRSQLLQFKPPPASPLVKAVDPRSVLGHAGVDHSYELKTINGIQTRYLSLEQISITMRNAVKPCVLHFALSDDAEELQRLQNAAITSNRYANATTLAATAVFAAVCI